MQHLIVEMFVARFSERMITDVVQEFWEAMQQGDFITEAAEKAGTYRKMGARWLAAAEGGIRPRRGRDLKGRCLTFGDREVIAVGRAAGESIRSIALRLGRSPSTVSRELARNTERGRYVATAAHALAYQRAGRPKPAKLASNPVLRDRVEQDLAKKFSPEQIVGRLLLDFPDDLDMRISVETIYQAVYMPSRGGLRREVTRCLRTGRSLRRPCRKAGQRKNRILDMVNIKLRPAEADDRTVVGHWEGDLIIGKNNTSAIGTLVERSTGLTMLVHLPHGYKSDQVPHPLIAQLKTVPSHMLRSLAWDQGAEMRDWKQIAAAVGIDIYFCDPHSPWQRGTNENT